MKLQQIIAIDHHRNGICGSPFDVVLFQDTDDPRRRKVAILFEPQSCCAVLDVDKLAAGDIAFGSNSWRGDQYEPLMRHAIKKHRQGQAEADCQHAESGADIHELLANHRQIAAIWGIEDVQSIRPDLSEEQAWEVLQQVDRHKDTELGVTWLTLEMAAEDLFGDAPDTDKAQEA
jgi:hypothetical protein